MYQIHQIQIRIIFLPLTLSTLFENYSKCRIWSFLNLAFSTNFCPIKTDLSGNTVWPKLQVFKNSPNGQFLARNIEWDFFCDFQTSWNLTSHSFDFFICPTLIVKWEFQDLLQIIRELSVTFHNLKTPFFRAFNSTRIILHHLMKLGLFRLTKLLSLTVSTIPITFLSTYRKTFSTLHRPPLLG